MTPTPPEQKLSVSIETTDRCNLSCIHCLRATHYPNTDLDPNLFEHILNQLKTYSNPHIAFTGGEPLLHPDFIHMIKKTSEKKLTMHFVTNGTLPQKTAEAINAAGKYLLSVSISLDGANEKIHDTIRGKGSFKKTMASIAVCRVKNIPVVCQTALHKLNAKEIKQLIQICEKLGVSHLRFSRTQPTPKAIKTGILLSAKEWNTVENTIYKEAKTAKIPISLAAGSSLNYPPTPCRPLAGNAINIDKKGRLTLCCQLSDLDGSDNNTDIIADLSHTPLKKAHQKMIDLAAEVTKARIRDNATKKYIFPCDFCLHYFQKTKWMKNYKGEKNVKRSSYHSQPASC